MPQQMVNVNTGCRTVDDFHKPTAVDKKPNDVSDKESNDVFNMDACLKNVEDRKNCETMQNFFSFIAQQ